MAGPSRAMKMKGSSKCRRLNVSGAANGAGKNVKSTIGNVGSGLVRPPPKKLVGIARSDASNVPTETLNGVVFQPFAEVQSQLASVTQTANASMPSLARQNFAEACESALNDQINVEFNVSYVYHALWAYFDRDYVSLPGMAGFFKKSSHEEREHAELLMEYQNKRGGKVKLQSIMMPDMEFGGSPSGDALYAMELALSLEKLVNEKLLNLHQVADNHSDPQMTDFLEGNFLAEQVDAIKQISGYVSELRRVGKGHGVYHFDLQLQNV